MRFYVYLLAISSITTVLVYLINLPEFITNAPDLIYEYYYKNPIKTFILDIFLVAIYIAISMLITKFFNIDINNNVKQLLVVASTTTLISGLFMIYFTSIKKSNSFFYRWFNTVSYKAIIYDVIIVCSVFTTMMILSDKIKNFQ